MENTTNLVKNEISFEKHMQSCTALLEEARSLLKEEQCSESLFTMEDLEAELKALHQAFEKEVELLSK